MIEPLVIVGDTDDLREVLETAADLELLDELVAVELEVDDVLTADDAEDTADEDPDVVAALDVPEDVEDVAEEAGDDVVCAADDEVLVIELDMREAELELAELLEAADVRAALDAAAVVDIIFKL
ncbi:hypothetical protein QFC19_003369 [Naganishia cerealis]|uniref:Uncharacterized protein n=1 Tax=Naganishia cerealis TaxID=610337 RepID=A0ACC2W2H2_9TREE|nr:hypothetical protein QFC19_003369 [Naganishia cerealis]